jgi:signal transduction histidine kinase
MILSYIGIYNFITAIQSEIVNELKIIAHNFMDKLSRQMFERAADIRFLSTNNILSNPNVTLSEKMNYLRSLERATKSYSSIAIYDTKGIKIGDTRNILLGKNDSQMDFIKEPRKGVLHIYSIPIMSESLNQLVIHFSAPIYNKDKKIQDIVVASYPINKINDVFKENVLSKENRLQNDLSHFEVDLISNKGTIIYSNHDRKSILQTSPELQGLIPKNTGPFNSADASNYGVEDSGIKDDQIFVTVSQENGYLDYRGSGWYLVLRENTNFVFGNLPQLVNQYMFVSAVILVLTILSILLLANRTISRPLSKLMEKVVELGDGKFNSKILFDSKDEIGKLASTFELMRRNVTEVNQNLNDLVRERTLELEKANEELKSNEENLRNLNRELVVADTAKEEFMSMISHELKTPLVPAKGYVEMLLRYGKIGALNDRQKKYINIIYKNLQKLEFLVNDVLDVYKLDIGKLRMTKKRIDLKEMIKIVISDAKEIILDKNIDLVIDVKTNDEIVLYCDTKRIAQVFANLIKNSMDFVPSNNGKITIKAETIENDSKVRFSVEDNGVGIPQEETNYLFQKFYQIDTRFTRKHGGTGLGLVICKGILEAHGGNIWIDKTFLNGASFKFELPILNNNLKDEVNDI